MKRGRSQSTQRETPVNSDKKGREKSEFSPHLFPSLVIVSGSVKRQIATGGEDRVCARRLQQRNKCDPCVGKDSAEETGKRSGNGFLRSPPPLCLCVPLCALLYCYKGVRGERQAQSDSAAAGSGGKGRPRIERRSRGKF